MKADHQHVSLYAVDYTPGEKVGYGFGCTFRDSGVAWLVLLFKKRDIARCQRWLDEGNRKKALLIITVSPQERLLVIERADDLGRGFTEGRRSA